MDKTIKLGNCVWAEIFGNDVTLRVRPDNDRERDFENEPDEMVDGIELNRKMLRKLFDLLEIGRVKILTDLLEEIAEYARENDEPEEEDYDDTAKKA